ncbi:MAG: hypothetical protein N2044_03890 [Cyclobacteriaceae bacterium]|nr:hypothetical protein [Cyclobacteriaceae bacterium]
MKKIIFMLMVGFFSCTSRTSEKANETSSAEQPSFQGICGYLTISEMEDALGVNLTGTPEEFSDADMGTGCSFNGAEGGGNANFGYIAAGGSSGFEKAKTGEPVVDVGDEAYLVNGADALQLWARQGNNYVVVALGDKPRPEPCKKLARLLLQRFEAHPFQ